MYMCPAPVTLLSLHMPDPKSSEMRPWRSYPSPDLSDSCHACLSAAPSLIRFQTPCPLTLTFPGKYNTGYSGSTLPDPQYIRPQAPFRMFSEPPPDSADQRHWYLRKVP